jgi:hypothetical protein
MIVYTMMILYYLFPRITLSNIAIKAITRRMWIMYPTLKAKNPIAHKTTRIIAMA